MFNLARKKPPAARQRHVLSPVLAVATLVGGLTAATVLPAGAAQAANPSHPYLTAVNTDASPWNVSGGSFADLTTDWQLPLLAAAPNSNQFVGPIDISVDNPDGTAYQCGSTAMGVEPIVIKGRLDSATDLYSGTTPFQMFGITSQRNFLVMDGYTYGAFGSPEQNGWPFDTSNNNALVPSDPALWPGGGGGNTKAQSWDWSAGLGTSDGTYTINPANGGIGAQAWHADPATAVDGQNLAPGTYTLIEACLTNAAGDIAVTSSGPAIAWSTLTFDAAGNWVISHGDATTTTLTKATTTDLQATVDDGGSPAASAGSVEFYDTAGGTATLLGSATVNGSGVADLSSFGGHTVATGDAISATFIPADVAAYDASTADVATATAGTGTGTGGTTVGTATTLTASPASPAAQGATVTLKATVTAASGSTTPSGTVDFMDGPSVIDAEALSSTGTASYAYAPDTGQHSYTAVYEGSDSFATSTSSAVAYTVGSPQSATGSGSEALSVTIQPAAAQGSFSLTIPDSNPVTLAVSGDGTTAAGSLNPVVVSDTRQGSAGWTVSGQSGQFSDGTGNFSGNQLGWAPSATDTSGATVTAGGTVAPAAPGLGSTAADLGSSVGASGASLGAALNLAIPAGQPAGTYQATFTVTAI